MTAGWQLAYVDGVVARHDPGSVYRPRSGRERLAVRNALLSLWLRRPTGVAAQQSLRCSPSGAVGRRQVCSTPYDARQPHSANGVCCPPTWRARCGCWNDVPESLNAARHLIEPTTTEGARPRRTRTEGQDEQRTTRNESRQHASRRVSCDRRRRSDG
jgi:hypothetical protein